MAEASKPATATASFWLTVGGLVLLAARKRRAAGAALCAVGFGYGGVVIERLTGDDVRKLPGVTRRDIDLKQLAVHVAAAAAGVRLLMGGRS